MQLLLAQLLVQRHLRQSLLSFLNLEHFFFDGTFDNVADGGDGAFLTDSVLELA